MSTKVCLKMSFEGSSFGSSDSIANDLGSSNVCSWGEVASWGPTIANYNICLYLSRSSF
jgi:hypothetical protein